MNTLDLEALNQRFAINNADTQLCIELGASNFPIIDINNKHAHARISLYGGQVLSYRPQGAAQDMLFLSEKALYQSGKAIRGGAPLCWPWFGADPEQQGRPAHGFARTSMWQLTQVNGDEQATQITLTLNDSPETLAIWPHRFKLTLTISIGKTLKIALSTHNPNPYSFAISQAIHSYFAVSDITKIQLIGLNGISYIDKSKTGANREQQQNDELHISKEVDRIYTNAPNHVALEDNLWQRRIHIGSQNSQTTVVWNPWVEIAAVMTDLNDRDYQKFICVEVANVINDMRTLAPMDTHELIAEYEIHDRA